MTHNYLEDSVHQPSAADVKQAEIVVNVVDGIAYTSTDGSDVVDMGGAIVHQNPNVLNHNYELRAGMSGVVASGFRKYWWRVIRKPKESRYACWSRF